MRIANRSRPGDVADVKAEMDEDELIEIQGLLPSKHPYKGPSEYALLRGKRNEKGGDWRNPHDE